MKKICLFIFILFSACSTNNVENSVDNNIEFSEKMSMDEFKVKLKVYSKKSEYPNIDN